MVKPTTVLIANIIVPERYRIDYGDQEFEELKDSLYRYGLIQPVVLNQSGELVAGGRRLRAATELGWTEIAVFYKETMTEDERLELELEENVRRKDTTWQENALQIRKIHFMKSRRSALEGTKWTQERTGVMFGVTQGWVAQVLPVAEILSVDRNSPLWKCDSMNEAYKLLMAQRETEAKTLLAKESLGLGDVLPAAALTQPINQGKSSVVSNELLAALGSMDLSTLAAPQTPAIDVTSLLATNGNEAPTPEVKVLDTTKPKEKLVIDLGKYIWHGNSLDILKAAPEECVDHILTDPPYAIDMDNLQQENHGMNIEMTRAEHQVDENISYLEALIPLCFKVLRDKGFCVIFCDAMHWRWLLDLAVKAGFRAQRWPYVWCKTMGQNGAPGYNATKCTEFALMLRKGNATLCEHMNQNWNLFGKGPEDQMFGHPFAKPLELWAKFVNSISRQGQVLLDMNVGCGSMVGACIKTGRAWRAVETNAAHVGELMTNVSKLYRDHFPQHEIEFTYNKYKPLTDTLIG